MIPLPAFVPAPVLIGGIAFLATVYVVLLFSSDRSADLRRLVERYTGDEDQQEDSRTVVSASFWERVASPLFGALARVLSSTAPDQMRAEAARGLTMAGNPIGVSTFLALRGVSLFGLPLVYVGYVGMSGQSWGAQPLVILGLTIVIGRMLPNVLLSLRIAGRQKTIERSIPDAVDLIVACVEGGLSLDGAMMKVSERMEGPLSDEIGRALHEISLGRPRRDALKEMAERTGVQSLRNFSQAIAHAEQMGVSIADVLRTLAEQLRTRRRLKAQEMAQKAPVKMIPVIIVFILPSLFTVVLGPALITILDFFGK